MSFFQVQVDDNLTIQPLWMGGEGCRTTCNRCHTAMRKPDNGRKVCKACREELELRRVQGWKRWARHTFQRRNRRP